MRATIRTGEVTLQVRAVRLTDQRVVAAVPPQLEDLLADRESLPVTVVLEERPDRRDELEATATIVRSGRTWTEARGRLREERGWARRFARSPAEVVVLTPTTRT